MNKIMKRKLIGAILCLIIGAVVIVYTKLNQNNLSEESVSYFTGFIVGLAVVVIYTIVINILFIKVPDKVKAIKNAEKDERLVSINLKAMAISFRFCVLIQALASVYFSIIGNMILAQNLGFLICVEIATYLISYFVFAKIN